MSVQDRLAVVDRLRALPFPPEAERDGQRTSGPRHHVCVLKASRDFWDDRGEDVVEAAEAEIDAAFLALSAALTARWGEPEPVDLWPYLEGENEPPEPMGELCQLSDRMYVWQPPECGRWVALAVGQADPEFPIQLLATVSNTPLP